MITAYLILAIAFLAEGYLIGRLWITCENLKEDIAAILEFAVDHEGRIVKLEYVAEHYRISQLEQDNDWK